MKCLCERSDSLINNASRLDEKSTVFSECVQMGAASASYTLLCVPNAKLRSVLRVSTHGWPNHI